MLHTSSKRIASFFVLNNLISNEDAPVYAYGIELMLATILNTIVVCAIGIALGRFIETILFLASFAVLRSFGGGYHASTHVKCLLVLVASFAANMVVLRIVPADYILVTSLVLQLVSIHLIFKYAPVESENKPLSDKEKQSYKMKSRSWSLALAAIAWIGSLVFPRGQELFFSITLGLFTAAGSTCAAVIKLSKKTH